MNVPAGKRECSACMLHHPDRAKKPCSAYGQCQNAQKDCSMHIPIPEGTLTVEEHIRRRLEKKD